MSSVTRFLKQHDTSQMFLTRPAALNTLYEFVTTDTTSNYPVGYVRLASTTDNVELTAQLTLLQDASVAAGAASRLLLRDMGKTIYAATASGANPTYGYYRQVQVLVPSTSSSATGATSVFSGVGGSVNTKYLTLYIPVPIAGVLGHAPVAGVGALAGGEM